MFSRVSNMERRMRRLSPSAGKGAEDREQDYGAGGCYDEVSNESDRFKPKYSEKKSAENCADHADCQIADDSPSPAFHDVSRQPAGKYSDNNETDKVHSAFPFAIWLLPNIRVKSSSRRRRCPRLYRSCNQQPRRRVWQGGGQ